MELRKEWRNSRKTMFEEDEIYKENFARLSEAAEDKGRSFSSDRERENKVIGLMAKISGNLLSTFMHANNISPWMQELILYVLVMNLNKMLKKMDIVFAGCSLKEVTHESSYLINRAGIEFAG